MKTKAIIINVDEETAKYYESLFESDRKKIDVLLNLRLREIQRQKNSLEDVMNNISEKAELRGLTPKILKNLLDEN
jgi:predicted metalloprotease with PDZ domain